VVRHRLDRLAELGANRSWHRFDSVAVHLLEAPQDPVGCLQHPLEGIAAPVMPAERRFLLLDTSACAVDHLSYLS